MDEREADLKRRAAVLSELQELKRAKIDRETKEAELLDEKKAILSDRDRYSLQENELNLHMQKLRSEYYEMIEKEEQQKLQLKKLQDEFMEKEQARTLHLGIGATLTPCTAQPLLLSSLPPSSNLVHGDDAAADDNNNNNDDEDGRGGWMVQQAQIQFEKEQEELRLKAAQFGLVTERQQAEVTRLKAEHSRLQSKKQEQVLCAVHCTVTMYMALHEGNCMLDLTANWARYCMMYCAELC